MSLGFDTIHQDDDNSDFYDYTTTTTAKQKSIDDQERDFI